MLFNSYRLFSIASIYAETTGFQAIYSVAPLKYCYGNEE